MHCEQTWGLAVEQVVQPGSQAAGALLVEVRVKLVNPAVL
jgi:hypothetical protein